LPGILEFNISYAPFEPQDLDGAAPAAPGMD
jgi:hypothetical protein